MADIARMYEAQTLTIANAATTSDAADMRRFVGAQLNLPATFTGTSISFTTSDTQGGTYQTLYDAAGIAVALSVTQARNYDLPPELAGCAFFKVVSNASEGGARTLTLIKKG